MFHGRTSEKFHHWFLSVEPIETSSIFVETLRNDERRDHVKPT
jgi:hypothetical protein